MVQMEEAPVGERVAKRTLAPRRGRLQRPLRRQRGRLEDRHRVLQDQPLPGLLLAALEVRAEVPEPREDAGREPRRARAALHALEAEADLEGVRMPLENQIAG